jgi:hypothetical protein
MNMIRPETEALHCLEVRGGLLANLGRHRRVHSVAT